MRNEVNIFNEKNYFLDDFPKLVDLIFNLTLLKTLLAEVEKEIAVIFIDEKKSLELNNNFRKKNYIADVLSFPSKTDEITFVGLEEDNDLGDIYICYDKALKQSQEYNHSLTRELSFLFLHGLLHNLGYDHERIEDEEIMFGLQDQILNELKILRN